MRTFNESFRVLCSNVTAVLAELEQPTVVITSSKPEEGKTVTAAKLAAVFAARGQRVVIVDLDLRNPGVHLALGITNQVGVTDVLRGHRKLGDCLQYVRLPQSEGFDERGLFVVTGGPFVPEPNELLNLPRAERMLASLANQADVVLIDSPPVLAVADTLTIAGMAGAAVVVVDTRRTNADSLQRTKDLLDRNGTRIIGMVLNQVHANDASVSAAEGYGYGPAATGRSHGA
jgi:capsular exopolysaccharide synthesis family protein